jgi:ferrous iron transport protein B
MPEYVVALAGNPNTGKTTIFNYLTGSSQHTGNWPGKTVERKEGVWQQGEDVFHIVDLPGAYSLSAFSAEEVIARDFIVEEQPDAVVVVVDATNLERNLYLALQILEMTPHVALALNMMDAAKNQGLEIDVEALSQRLGVPVAPMTARAGKGLDKLAEALIQVAREGRAAKAHPDQHFQPPIRYSEPIETAIERIARTIDRHETLKDKYPIRWLALRLLQEDETCIAKVANIPGTEDVLTLAKEERARLLNLYHEDIDTLVAEERYTWINKLVSQVVQGRPLGPTFSDRVDAVVTHPVAGLFIFFGVMWVIFKLSTDVAAPLVNWIDTFINGHFAHWVTELLALVHLQDSWIASMIVDGLLAGVGGVLVFVPVLMFLYMGMAIMEDSGYMARAAFVMDRYMRKLGLQGKSFVPLVLGFGCNVPAIYATRTLESRTDRILTGLLVPFMSCGARLPVYVLIATIFFPDYATGAVLAMYILGIVMALIVGLLLRKTIFKQSEENALLIEVPAYRMPTVRNVWTEMWQRTRAFLEGAATIIMSVSLIIWLFMAIPVSGEGSFANTPVDDSAFAHLAGAISPVFEPLGFGNWENASALISGFIAKEVVVSTLAQVYHVPQPASTVEDAGFIAQAEDALASLFQAIVDTIKSVPAIIGIDLLPPETEAEPPALMTAIQQGFEESSGGYGALAALAFMVYVLLYSPCVATMAAQRQELGSRWMWMSIAIQLTLGWVLAFIVFQGGKLLLS